MKGLKLIEGGLQVGPRHCGHTRDIYTAHGVEVWHEVSIPWNPLRLVMDGLYEAAFVYPARLPESTPAGAASCGMVEPYYGTSPIAEIVWRGPNSLDRAVQWISEQHNETRKAA